MPWNRGRRPDRLCSSPEYFAPPLRERDAGEYTLRADYLIAADGHASPIRETRGINRDGRGFLRTIRSVLCRALLEEYLESGISQFEIEQPDLTAMLTTYRDGRWSTALPRGFARSRRVHDTVVGILRAIGGLIDSRRNALDRMSGKRMSY
jgi:2-polyprenyl-6-methoxyphenol hydroxylase-like FAD-dependent oxidoreductase